MTTVQRRSWFGLLGIPLAWLAGFTAGNLLKAQLAIGSDERVPPWGAVVIVTVMAVVFAAAALLTYRLCRPAAAAGAARPFTPTWVVGIVGVLSVALVTAGYLFA